MVEITAQVQKFIFEHPFYNRFSDDGKSISLLVIGDGAYADKFTDVALQIGQMDDAMVKIYRCVNSLSTRDRYLEQRPALIDFVRVDGVLRDESKEAYGEITFIPADRYSEQFSEECRYIFAATEDYKFNYDTAKLFKTGETGNWLSSYLGEKGIEVYYDGDIAALENREEAEAHKRLSSQEELDRMAFNTHMVWEGNGNIEYENLKARFADPYYYNSSVNFVLSIPYKLIAAGIRDADPYDAARKLYKLIKESKKKKSDITILISKLAVLEHRRWLIEKATEGIRSMSIKEMAELPGRGTVKGLDEDGKVVRHPCLVRSTAETPLKTAEFEDHARWDNENEGDNDLDDLDYVSLTIHRAMHSAANALRDDRSGLEDSLGIISDVCTQGNAKLFRDYRRYDFCIKNIIDNSMPYASQFETYEKMLIREIDKLNRNAGYDIGGRALTEIKKIKKMLFPVIESNMHRDYKQNDVELIENIPFIMTGKRDAGICMSFGITTGISYNNEDNFRCVASATALYSNDLQYIYVVERNTNADIFAAKIKAVRNYFELRGRKCIINMAIFCSEDPICRSKLKKLVKQLEQLKERGILEDYETCDYDSMQTLAGLICEKAVSCGADYFDGTNPFSSSSLENSFITRQICNTVPYFEFDSYNRRFVNCINCDYLNYLRITSFIQVEDMFALLNAGDTAFNYQDYSDCYKDFWSVMSGEAISNTDFAACAKCWNKLCAIMQTVQKQGTTKIENSTAKEIIIIKAMLRKLKEMDYLKNLVINDRENTVFAKTNGKKVKDIFAKAGDLLEVYVYFEACRQEWFDDVQTGYKFKWEYGDVENELDCVLTKGYRSILVECKSVASLSENYYLTLDSLGDHFGIGYKKVLIAVTDTGIIGDERDTAYKNYKKYLSRGDQMDIITISSYADLSRIGEKLIEIMKA